MSTFTKSIGLPDTDLSDKVAEVKSSFALQQEPAPVAVKKETKKTTTSKE